MVAEAGDVSSRRKVISQWRHSTNKHRQAGALLGQRSGDWHGRPRSIRPKCWRLFLQK